MQVKAQKVGPLVAMDLAAFASCYRKFLSGEDDCESDAAGRTQEPDLGVALIELLAAELQLAACLSMGFDGGRASSLWSESFVRAQSDARRVPIVAVRKQLSGQVFHSFQAESYTRTAPHLME